MTGLPRKRLARELGPETGQGFRDYLDFNEEAETLGLHQFDRLLEAAIRGDVLSGAAEVAPETAARISIILDRAETHGAKA